MMRTPRRNSPASPPRRTPIRARASALEPPRVTATPTPPAGGGWMQDNAYGLLLAGLPWVLIATLVVRWDWLSAGQQTLQQVGQAYGQDPFSRIIKLSMLGLSTFVVLRRLTLARAVLRELNLMFIVFVVLVPVSALWSISPGASSR